MSPIKVAARLSSFHRLLGRLTAAGILLAASPAWATFHISHIQRLMSGLNGATDVQYVEIVMDALGQTHVDTSKLIAFDSTGAFDHVILTVPSSPTIASGDGRPWIMASNGFQAASGIKPDFTFDSTGGKGLIPENGMVCWGKPVDQTDPDSTDMIDCVSYGNYTGPANVHTSAPSAVTPFGHGLNRIATTHDSATDFACEDPAMPANNAQQTGQIDASTSCSAAAVCGDNIVEGSEECDDGNTAFSSGDECSATCTLVPCGIPTNPNGTSPKTSDALFVLKVSVGSVHCDVHVCDVNNSGAVTTSDALIVLKAAVGQNVSLNCPLLTP
ncbi:MAG TPA: hypothetical protein VGK20_09035 [Candidatus Binatia bacterium]|jgi:cysteine-rich repeat protein